VLVNCLRLIDRRNETFSSYWQLLCLFIVYRPTVSIILLNACLRYVLWQLMCHHIICLYVIIQVHFVYYYYKCEDRSMLLKITVVKIR